MLFLEIDPNFFMVLSLCCQSTVTERSSQKSSPFQIMSRHFSPDLMNFWRSDGIQTESPQATFILRESWRWYWTHLDARLNRVEPEKVVCQIRIHSSRVNILLHQQIWRIFDECVRTANTRLCVFKHVREWSRPGILIYLCISTCCTSVRSALVSGPFVEYSVTWFFQVGEEQQINRPW